MKYTAKILWLALVAIVCLSGASFAGNNPFSGTVVSIPDAVYTPATTNQLPPVVEGKPEEATVVVEDSLNVRTSPWGDVVGVIKNGDKVNIIGQNGDWYKISVDGKTSYVHSSCIKREGEGEKTFPKLGWVNAPLGLNVRRVPDGDVVGSLKDQMQVRILGVSGNYYKIKWGDNNEAFINKHYVDSDQPEAPSSADEVNFVGKITAQSGLNVRTAPWGAIDTALPYGISVKVTGKIDDWYRIDYNGKVRYVHSNWIAKEGEEPSTQGTTTAGPVASAAGGSLQSNIVRSARALVGSTNFRGSDVAGGRLACAKVVTTALKNAGALDKVHLNCRSTISDLRSHGWQEVNVPPFQEGDVITWKTYDYTGDGVKDDDTHIGIICKEGNSFKAMNNSSRLRMPRMMDPFAIQPVSRVMRKVA